MSLFGRRGKARLAPELDDARLGAAMKKIQATPQAGSMDLGTGLLDMHIDRVEELLQQAGHQDWDRRTHWFTVLATTVTPSTIHLWSRRRPEGTDLLLLHAWAVLLHGRRRGWHDDPQAIIAACHRAARLQPADPGPWTVLLGVLRDLRRGPREVFPVWNELVRRDAWHREGHLQMLGYLSPEECGSSTQQNSFVDSAVARMPFGAPPVALELHVLLSRYRRAVTDNGLTGLLADRIFDQPVAESVLGQALSTWPQPGFLSHAAALADLNVLAYLAAHARHRNAASAFRAVGTTVTSWPWRLDGDPLEQYSTWHKYFLARGRR